MVVCVHVCVLVHELCLAEQYSFPIVTAEVKLRLGKNLDVLGYLLDKGTPRLQQLVKDKSSDILFSPNYQQIPYKDPNQL